MKNAHTCASLKSISCQTNKHLALFLQVINVSSILVKRFMTTTKVGLHRVLIWPGDHLILLWCAVSVEIRGLMIAITCCALLHPALQWLLIIVWNKVTKTTLLCWKWRQKWQLNTWENRSTRHMSENWRGNG